MTTSTVAPEIAKFAAAVRDALADLPDEERDELTDGLEADLSESLAEDLRRTLPDPVAYAAELRAAAGLPMRVKSRGTFAGLAQGWRDTRTDIGVAIRRNPGLAAAMEFLGVLRPIWWVIRAWLATWLIASFFGSEQGYGFQDAWWVVFMAFAILSVQWGRGLWLAKGVPALVVIGNVVAAVSLVPVLAAANDWSHTEVYSADQPLAGTAIDSEQVQNIFAYDAKGNLLQNVQLFDETGRPLDVGQDTMGPECNDGCSANILRLPRTLDNGKTVRNVFPLLQANEEDASLDDRSGRYVLQPGAHASEPSPPFVKVPAVLDTEKVAKSNH